MARPSNVQRQTEKKLKKIRLNEWDKLLVMYKKYQQRQQSGSPTYGFGTLT